MINVVDDCLVAVPHGLTDNRNRASLAVFLASEYDNVVVGAVHVIVNDNHSTEAIKRSITFAKSMFV